MKDSRGTPRTWVALVCACCLGALLRHSSPHWNVLFAVLSSLSNPTTISGGSRGAAKPRTKTEVITVYSSTEKGNQLAAKQHMDLTLGLPSDEVEIRSVVLDNEQQLQHLALRCGGAAMEEKLQDLLQNDLLHLATELWKYCVLQETSEDSYHATTVAFVDSSCPLLVRLQSLVKRGKSIAVLGDSYLPGTIHGSLLILQPQHRQIATEMFQLILNTPTELLASNPVLIPRTLYALIVSVTSSKSRREEMPAKSSHGQLLDARGDYPSWFFLEQECAISTHPNHNATFRWELANSRRLVHHCPDDVGFCCSVVDAKRRRVVQMTQQPLHPLLTSAATTHHRPFNARSRHYKVQDLPYISFIREVSVAQMPSSKRVIRGSPGLFDELLRNDCFPSDLCNNCLRVARAGCDVCSRECGCYCDALCQLHESIGSTAVTTRRWFVTPPLHTPTDPNRLVPKLVHQLLPDDNMDAVAGSYWYPDTSRAVRSFSSHPGWEYRQYLPEDMMRFLATHFPDDVVRTFKSLSSHALQNDLFRYCILLIHGGVFVNENVLLESQLDAILDPDVGFMVSTDSRIEGCLWQGLIAAAPGHPFLAKAIENVVNQVGNRFTLLDADAMLCPTPRFVVNRIDKTSAVTGSCLLAKSVNQVLLKSPEAIFSPGDVATPKDTARHVPGRFVVLRGDNNDMGGHRITHASKNAIVAQVDLPVVDEQPRVDDTTKLGKPYDFDPMYTDHFNRSHEAVEIIIRSRAMHRFE